MPDAQPLTSQTPSQRRPVGTLTADDLGKRVTLDDATGTGWTGGMLVRIDHSIRWGPDAATFVGFAADVDLAADPDMRLQRFGIQLPPTTLCDVADWAPLT